MCLFTEDCNNQGKAYRFYIWHCGNGKDVVDGGFIYHREVDICWPCLKAVKVQLGNMFGPDPDTLPAEPTKPKPR